MSTYTLLAFFWLTMFVGLDKKISHTKFQVSRSNSFLYMKVQSWTQNGCLNACDQAKVALLPLFIV